MFKILKLRNNSYMGTKALETKAINYGQNSSPMVSDLVFVNIIAILIIFLSTFVPVVSIALPILFAIYFEVGVFGSALNFFKQKDFKYEEIFYDIRLFPKVLCVAIVKMLSTAFLLIFLIVPGIIYALEHSFTSLIIFDGRNLDARSVLYLSKELTRGYRYKIFLWSLIALATMCVATISMFIIILLFDLFLEVPTMFYIIFVLIANILDMLLVVFPLLEIQITKFYVTAKEKCNFKTKLGSI